MRDTDLLTSAEAASILRCTPDNIRKLSREGQLEAAVTVGRGQRLYERRSVEGLAERREQQRASGGAR